MPAAEHIIWRSYIFQLSGVRQFLHVPAYLPFRKLSTFTPGKFPTCNFSTFIYEKL
jgi:hypothetical protein